MQSLKSFLLDGLIQAALLLSLCGVRVQVEPERSLLELGPASALPPLPHPHLDLHLGNNLDLHLHNLRNTLQEEGHSLEPKRSLLELGPTSALPRPHLDLHLHDLRNALQEGGHALHPKSPDLDQFFTARRLLGWVRSLDRLQVPQTELEAWLVQQDPAPLPVRLLHSAPDRLLLPSENHTSRGTETGWEEPVEAWEEPGEEPERNYSQVDRSRVETDGDMSLSDGGHMEDDQSAASLQECLRLLESFPLTHEQQELVCDPGPPRMDGPPTVALGPPTVALGPPSEVEQHWQDLLDLMDPQSSDVEMLNLLEPESEHERPLMDGYLQHGPRSDTQLLPLLPSDQLDDPPSGPAPLLPEEDHELPPSFLLDERELAELLGEADLLEDMGLLREEEELQEEEEELQEEAGFGTEMTHRLEQEGYLDPELTRRTSRLSLDVEPRPDDYTDPTDVPDELDSDSGLSLDSSRSPPSPSDSEASSYSSSSSSSSSYSPRPSPMELEVTIKEEPLDYEDEEEEEQLVGAVGGHSYDHQESKLIFSNFYNDQKLLDGFQQVVHDHTYNQRLSRTSPKDEKLYPYNQPSQFSPKISSRTSPKHERPYSFSKPSHFSTKTSSRSSFKRESPYSKHLWGRDERRARAFKIPISNELIVNLPVEDFNELLTRYHLDENQLNLIRDIRRRGKNKIAAQNCRKRKMDTLVSLEKDVGTLRRRRSKLQKEKQEALRKLQEMEQTMERLYQDVFSGLRDGDGRPLDANEFTLSFERDGSVEVVSRRRNGKDKSRRKHR